MKVKCLSLALAAGLVCGSTAMADPAGKAADGSVVALRSGVQVENVLPLPKGATPGRATYRMATGEWIIHSRPGTVASDANLRGPGPVAIWESVDQSGFYTNRIPGGALREALDWGLLCGDVGNFHTVNQFSFAYATADPDGTPGLAVDIWFYWDFDTSCPPGPQGQLAGFNCLANDGVGFDIGGLPGSPGGIAGWIVDIDLSGGFEFNIPAGADIGYSYANWRTFTNAGPLITNENQIAAPGTENAFDSNTSAPQVGYIGTFWFGGTPYAQFYMEVYAQAACPVGTLGACCDTVLQTCTLTEEVDCQGAGQNYIGVGIPCSPVICLPVPANDLCANAETISGFGQFAYDNRNAGEDGPADCTAQYPADTARTARDVWFKWTAPCSGTVQITSCGLNLTDDKAVVYVGNDCNDLSNIAACDDDGCGIVGGAVDMSFLATGGQVYLIRMGVYPAPGNGGENFFDIVNVDNCTPGPSCPPDWNNNTLVEVADIFAFLGDWFGGVPAAVNFGGTPGVPAIFAFLTTWFTFGVGPCP